MPGRASNVNRAETSETRPAPFVITTKLIITKIEPDSPINYLKVNDIIVEAGKRRIKSASQLNNLVNTALKSQNKTILIAIFNNQNQKRYIGVKLD